MVCASRIYEVERKEVSYIKLCSSFVVLAHCKALVMRLVIDLETFPNKMELTKNVDCFEFLLLGLFGIFCQKSCSSTNQAIKENYKSMYLVVVIIFCVIISLLRPPPMVG